jgi:hypothetical protein
MAVSLRYRGNLKKLHFLLEEAAIENQPTLRIPSARGRETDRLPQLEFFHIEERYPIMKIVRAVEKWMERGKVPPRCMGLSYATLGGYWQVLRLSVYYYRFPDGRLWTIELKPMDIPDSVVYCSAKRP